MTSNQRRPGFRLPWSGDDDSAGADEGAATNGSAPQPAEGADMTSETSSPDAAEPAAVAAGEGEVEFEAPVAPAAAAGTTGSEPTAPAATAEPASVPEEPLPGAAFARPESPSGFMRDLVAAMRRVAEETRQASLAELRTKSEEQVRALEAETERRREELRMRAETDIAGVGEWERAEQERIRQEAEQKVVSRRAQLDQQLAAEMSRSQAETQALRDRVAAYERELDAYHAQLSDIADPAAFAAAAKRMPPPPQLGPAGGPETDTATAAADTPGAADQTAGVATKPAAEPATTAAAEPADAAAADAAATDAAGEEAAPSPEAASPEAEAKVETPAAADAVESGGSAPPDAPTAGGDGTGGAAAGHETVATEVLVKGLGSFGAITGFRQALAGVEGIEGVSLSLGPTGEFVFRAIHPASFDVAAAIRALEGDAAVIEQRSEGGLRVTLERAR